MSLLMILAILAVIALVMGKLKEFIAICLLIAAICFIPQVASFLGPMLPAGVGSIIASGGWAAVALCVGLAYAVDPETTVKAFEAVSDAVVDIAEPVIDAGVEIANKVAKKFLSSPIGLGLLGVGLFMLLRGGDDDTPAVNKRVIQDDEGEIDTPMPLSTSSSTGEQYV